MLALFLVLAIVIFAVGKLPWDSGGEMSLIILLIVFLILTLGGRKKRLLSQVRTGHAAICSKSIRPLSITAF